MSDDQSHKDHDKLREEFNELRLTVISQSATIAQLDQDVSILKSKFDQLKKDG